MKSQKTLQPSLRVAFGQSKQQKERCARSGELVGVFHNYARVGSGAKVLA
jgi:hypothetical protein